MESIMNLIEFQTYPRGVEAVTCVIGSASASDAFQTYPRGVEAVRLPVIDRSPVGFRRTLVGLKRL
ncbi:hypothetical protein C463_14170 [Halorubrum californiense DSM 19288]|uniref:Uncharacterized protein n=1 Tax=Halorubrum californiense DSM 19288 TaxID=1227465 RepID=M0E326_9EURY|nr:hypothetical protein C463_14170 [Halorubrum californiense DSM 19288]